MSTVKDYMEIIDRYQKIISNSNSMRHEFCCLEGEEKVVKVPKEEYYDMLIATTIVKDLLLNAKIDSSDCIEVFEEDK